MKTEQEYIKDLSEIRLMMERSTRFLSLTGWSGIMAGIYALLGAYAAYRLFYKHLPGAPDQASENLPALLLVALVVLILAIGTAVYFSSKKSKAQGEILWNPAAKRLVFNMAIPLITGGILILLMIVKGDFELLAPLSLIFYGLALITASNFSFNELKSLGILEIILGLIAVYFVGYGLILWAVGFGLMHIAYGIFMHLKYEK